MRTILFRTLLSSEYYFCRYDVGSVLYPGQKTNKNMLEKEWREVKLTDDQAIDAFANELNVDRIIARLLIQRGIDSFELAKEFFRPTLQSLHDPFFMTDMDKAITRLNDAIFNNERILIFGDYDVDGTTSVALMYNFLRELHDNLDAYVPDRYIEGYGISKKGIDYAETTGCTLIIALDCGITAVDEIDYANSKSIDFIICDHHLPGSQLPKACAVLDPKRKDCPYPYDQLSGCGVGFKLLQGFCIQNTIDLKRLYNYLDLVAVSIASDIVPITGENRVLAWFGLKKLNAQPIIGLKALIEIAGYKKEMDISDVVFGIGPRINAAGRISHAKSAVDLLTSQSFEDALLLSEKLNVNNKERKSYDESITHEALENIHQTPNYLQKKSTVLFNESWHKGIVGIVASRCIEKHYRPTIILTESNKKATGSARSVDGFDIYTAISTCSDLLDNFGGHRHAAGLTLELNKVDEFVERFESAVSELITSEMLVPKIKIDAEIELEEVDYSLYNILKQMGPFGPGNMQPVFRANNVVVRNKVRVLKDAHLKLFIGQPGSSASFDVIGFGLSEFATSLDDPFDIAFTIEENNYMGNRALQLNLKDIKIRNT